MSVRSFLFSEWARLHFDEFFVSGPDNFNSLLEGKEKYYKRIAANQTDEFK